MTLLACNSNESVISYKSRKEIEGCYCLRACCIASLGSAKLNSDILLANVLNYFDSDVHAGIVRKFESWNHELRLFRL